MVSCSDNQHPTTPQVGVTGAHDDNANIITSCDEYRVHQLLATEKMEVIDSLPDGNNELALAKINGEFAEKQLDAALVLLNNITLLRDGILASGVPFNGRLRVSSVEMSEGDGSTLVILGGTPLDQENKPLQHNPIELAVTRETFVFYAH